ncbi:MAG: hypothetical protein HOP11_02210 [Saprospiraceae bacterium]|nr:hypothetical protein [Saprospiraceae bacterium]
MQFLTSTYAQTVSTLTDIRGNYFILNGGKDSVFVQGLKNESTQLLFFFFAAEEDPIGLDPGLSTDGRWRALHLMQIFKTMRIGALISTPFRRNVLTIQPLSDAKKLEVNYYDQADLKALYDELKHLQSQEAVIMVHKETVSKIFEHYIQKPFTGNIENPSYDRIFVIERPVSGPCALHSFRYDIR